MLNSHVPRSWLAYFLGLTLIGLNTLTAMAQAPADNANQPPVPAGNDQTGYLGIVADDRADRGRGVRVLEVVSGAAGAEGGLQQGDLIVQANDQPIRSMSDLATVMIPTRAGDTVRFVVQRENEQHQVNVVLDSRPAPDQRRFPQFGRIDQPGNAPSAAAVPRRGLLGVRASPVTRQVQQQLHLPAASGAYVAGIVPGSPSAEVGIPVGSVIVAIDGQPVANPDDLARLVNQAGAGSEVEVQYVDRGGLVRRTVRLREAGADSSPQELVAPRDTNRPPSGEWTAPSSPLPDTEATASRLDRLEQRMERLEQLLEQLIESRSAPPPGQN